MIAILIFLLMVPTPAQAPAVASNNFKLAAAKVPNSQQAFADCVSHHESRGNYKAVGDKSSARGRWQFLDAQWRHGLSYMVANRLVTYGMSKSKTKDLVKDLQKHSIDTWKPVYQDIGFVAALNAKGPWSGWTHWKVNSECVKLVPSNKK